MCGIAGAVARREGVAPPEPTFADIGDAAQFIVGPSQWETQTKYSAEAAKTASVPFYGPTGADFTTAYKAKSAERKDQAAPHPARARYRTEKGHQWYPRPTGSPCGNGDRTSLE